MEAPPTEHEYGTEPADAQADPILELRLMMYGLGILVLLMSLSLNLYIRKQNHNIETQVDNFKTQIAQIEGSPLYQQNKSGMQNLLNELREQVPAHPEAVTLLGRYGIQVQQRPAPPKP
jgi:hypothetical protein